MWNTEIIQFIGTHLHGNDAIFKETPFYRGDPGMRKANLDFSLTDKERHTLSDIDDIDTYIKFVKHRTIADGFRQFEPYAYQHDFLRKVKSNRFVTVLKSRQTGFTLLASVLAMHFANTNFNKTFLFVTANNSMAADFISRVKEIYLGLPFFMKPGIISWNAKSVEFDNGCKIVAKSSIDGMLGSNVHFLYIDEAAFIKDFNLIHRSLVPVLIAQKSSNIVITSTLNGHDGFLSHFEKAETRSNEFISLKYPWTVVPQRDKAWADKEIANIGQISFDKEYALKFTFEPAVRESVVNKEPSNLNISADDVNEMLTPNITIESLMTEIVRIKNRIKYLEDKHGR